MGQTTLSDNQKKVIEAVAEEKNLSDFYLTGGTALAEYYYQHRVSQDLDFFAFEEIDNIFLHAFADKLKGMLNAADARFERVYDRNQFFFKVGEEELKIEFTKYPFKNLEEIKIDGRARIDSLRDIAANKLLTITERFDPKDFVDLYFILQEKDLKDVIEDVEQKFGVKLDPIFLGGELMKVKRIEALPNIIKPLSISGLKDFFEKLAKRFRPIILS